MVEVDQLINQMQKDIETGLLPVDLRGQISIEDLAMYLEELKGAIQLRSQPPTPVRHAAPPRQVTAPRVVPGEFPPQEMPPMEEVEVIEPTEPDEEFERKKAAMEEARQKIIAKDIPAPKPPGGIPRSRKFRAK